jgi:preprotein translocase subunit SecB
MTDTDTPAPAAMQIVVQAQYIKDLSFENPNAPGTLMPNKEPPKLDEVRVDVNARKMNDDHYEVVLVIKAAATMDNKPMFMLELTYGGLFLLKGLPEEALQPVLLIEAPRILFPFARNIVADVTRDGGFTPLMLQPIDFVELYRQQLAARQQQATGTA